MGRKLGSIAIVLDDITSKFLSVLRSERQRLKIRGRHVAEYCGCGEEVLRMYETGQTYPSLEVLMRLSELYGYDLSGSINHRYYFRGLRLRDIQVLVKRYGLTYKELSEQTGYSKSAVQRAVRGNESVSLECISSVLRVLEREKELEHYRRRR